MSQSHSKGKRGRVALRSIHQGNGAAAVSTPVYGLTLARLLTFTALAIAGLAGAPGPASAEPRIKIELNRIETVGTVCRLSFLFENGLPVEVRALSLETVLFDDKGRVDRFLVLKSKPLPPARTRVQQFDIRKADCNALGRVLLNDVRECAANGMEIYACAQSVKPSSLTSLPFGTSTQDSQTKTAEESIR